MQRGGIPVKAGAGTAKRHRVVATRRVVVAKTEADSVHPSTVRGVRLAERQESQCKMRFVHGRERAEVWW